MQGKLTGREKEKHSLCYFWVTDLFKMLFLISKEGSKFPMMNLFQANEGQTGLRLPWGAWCGSNGDRCPSFWNLFLSIVVRQIIWRLPDWCVLYPVLETYLMKANRKIGRLFSCYSLIRDRKEWVWNEGRDGHLLASEELINGIASRIKN